MRGAAGVAHLARLLPAHGQRLGQEGLLPRRAAHLAAEGLVIGVVQAQQVAMRDQQALAEGREHGRVVQGLQADVSHQRGAHQKIPVAGHEADATMLRGLPQHARAPLLEAARLGRRIVAHPHLEHVSQQEDGVGLRVLQVVGPGREGVRRVGPQVQVGDELDALPARRREHLGGGGQRHRGFQTSVIFWITTSSTGTSSCMPLRPVRTFSIVSITSWPDTTWPNTA